MQPYRFRLPVLIGLLLSILPASLSAGSEFDSGPLPKIHSIGDSTMANKSISPPNPEHGWGQLLPEFLADPSSLTNYAADGRSSKSFIDEGRWQKVLDALRPGDFVIIQFSHNDEKQDKPDRYTNPATTFRDNLRRFIRESRERGANPILATPVVRRKWDSEGRALVETHGAYPEAVRIVAHNEGAPLIDMEALTRQLEIEHGMEGSKKLHLWIPEGVYERKPAGYQDDTHYSEYGARCVALLAAQELRRIAPELVWAGLPVSQTRPSAIRAPDAVVAADGTAKYQTVQEAINAAPQNTNENSPWIILVKPGTYHEVVYVQREKRFVRLVGEDAARTVITAGLYANQLGADGKPLGTFRTPTVQIDADDFSIENITLANSAGNVGQALAVRVDGDRVAFRKCRFLGWQDTVLINRGRQYFADCYIEGATDYIFGGATAWFENCDIVSAGNSFITAASTPSEAQYGFVFNRCRIRGTNPEIRTYLGRPWRPYAAVTFMNCTMSEVVRSAGWDNWRDPAREKTARYLECNNTGPGAITTDRVPWARQISTDEGRLTTLPMVLSGWRPLNKP